MVVLKCYFCVVWCGVVCVCRPRQSCVKPTKTRWISNRVIFDEGALKSPDTLFGSNGLCAKWGEEGEEGMELAPTTEVIFLRESTLGEETAGDGKTRFALTPGCRGRVLIYGYGHGHQRHGSAPFE